MKKVLLTIVLLIVIISIAGYFWVKSHPEKLRTLVLPEIEQINEVDIQAKNDTAFINSKMIAFNKSFFSLKIDSIKYKISLFDKVYLNDEQYVGINLKPGEKDTIAVKFKVPYAILMKDLKKERESKEDSGKYSFEVSLIYATIMGKITLPINKSAKFRIPQTPEMKVVEISYKKMGLKNITADATIKIINHGQINLAVRDLSYQMNIIDHGTVNGNHKGTVNIKPHSEVDIHIPIEIKIKDIGKIIVDVLRDKDKYKYELKMNAVLGTTNLKLDPFKVNLSTNGIMELKK
ncbi:MAG: LEA type 2 family protein [Burkholderiales bacterium]|nr:LEA type 2 family protein [Bacteroidia bacterium]